MNSNYFEEAFTTSEEVFLNHNQRSRLRYDVSTSLITNNVENYSNDVKEDLVVSLSEFLNSTPIQIYRTFSFKDFNMKKSEE